MVKYLKYLLTTVLISVLLGAFTPVCTSADDSDDVESKIIVSMGDSYSAGEGNSPYYSPKAKSWINNRKMQNLTEEEMFEDWLSHRSLDSWPGQLKLPGVSGKMAYNRNTNWYFTAISGAITQTITNDYDKDYNYSKAEKAGFQKYEEGDYEELQHEPVPAQEKTLTTLSQEGKKIDYVTLTMGGNDIEFAEVVTMCAKENSLQTPNKLRSKLNSIWKKVFDGENGDLSIRDKLRNVYRKIQKLAGDDTHIIVAGYPKLFNPNGGAVLDEIGEIMNLHIDYEEANEIDNAVSTFNKIISDIITYCSEKEHLNIHYVSVEEAFEGHGAYSYYYSAAADGHRIKVDDSYIYPVKFRSSWDLKKGNIKDFNTLASEGSVHPNSKGMKAYAECVQAKIDELELNKTQKDVNEQFALNVLDDNGEHYGNYHLNIKGKQKSGLFGLKEEDYLYDSDVSLPGPVNVTLHKGEYIITITDNQGSEDVFRKKITVKSKGKGKSVDIKTTFGRLIVEGLQDARIPFGAREYNGHYYFIFTGRAPAKDDKNVTYSSIVQYCTDLGGYPATITSAEENEFLFQYAKETVSELRENDTNSKSNKVIPTAVKDVYFGLHKVSDFLEDEEEYGWKWATGESMIYRNWKSQEPNVFQIDCAKFNLEDGTWEDGNLTNDLGSGGVSFICEWGEPDNEIKTGTLSFSVVDSQNEPINNFTVKLTTIATSDDLYNTEYSSGELNSILMAAIGDCRVVIQKEGFEEVTLDVTVNPSEDVDLGVISLRREDSNIEEFTGTYIDGLTEEELNQYLDAGMPANPDIIDLYIDTNGKLCKAFEMYYATEGTTYYCPYSYWTIEGNKLTAYRPCIYLFGGASYPPGPIFDTSHTDVFELNPDGSLTVYPDDHNITETGVWYRADVNGHIYSDPNNLPTVSFNHQLSETSQHITEISDGYYLSGMEYTDSDTYSTGVVKSWEYNNGIFSVEGSWRQAKEIADIFNNSGNYQYIPKCIIDFRTTDRTEYYAGGEVDTRYSAKDFWDHMEATGFNGLGLDISIVDGEVVSIRVSP